MDAGVINLAQVIYGHSIFFLEFSRCLMGRKLTNLSTDQLGCFARFYPRLVYSGTSFKIRFPTCGGFTGGTRVIQARERERYGHSFWLSDHAPKVHQDSRSTASTLHRRYLCKVARALEVFSTIGSWFKSKPRNMKVHIKEVGSDRSIDCDHNRPRNRKWEK